MLADHRRSCHRVTVLGSFAVISSTGTEPGEAVPLGVDARRVVAYLAVHRRPRRRAQLAADLWPGALLDEASFDEALAAAAELLEKRADGMLALDPAVDVDLDEAMALVRTLADAAGRPEGVPADLARARALLAADILPGDPAPWLAVERERFRQIRLNATEELSAALSAAGRHTDAVAVADDAVRTAPSRESAPARALIEAHLAQGEIAEAVAQYDEYQDCSGCQRRSAARVGDGRCVRARGPAAAGARVAGPAGAPLHAARRHVPAGLPHGPRRPAPARGRRHGARHDPLTHAVRCRRTGVRVRCSPCMEPLNPTSGSTRTLARTRETGGSADGHPADRAEGDASGTTGTGEGEEFVGRVAGRDLGYAGETGAEARAEAGEDGEPVVTTPSGGFTGFAKLVYKLHSSRCSASWAACWPARCSGSSGRRSRTSPRPRPAVGGLLHARGADRRDDPGRGVRADHHGRQPLRHQGLPEVPELQGLSGPPCCRKATFTQPGCVKVAFCDFGHSPQRAQLGQHVGGELREEPLLVVSRPVEDQVVEPRVDVRLDLGHGLLGVGRRRSTAWRPARSAAVRRRSISLEESTLCFCSG